MDRAAGADVGIPVPACVPGLVPAGAGTAASRIRTAFEISQERSALKALRADFDAAGRSSDLGAALVAASAPEFAGQSSVAVCSRAHYDADVTTQNPVRITAPSSSMTLG